MSQTMIREFYPASVFIPRTAPTLAVHTGSRTGRQEAQREMTLPAAAARTRRYNASWAPAALGDARMVQSACWHRNSCKTCPGRASCRTIGR